MNQSELEKTVARGEGQQLEFKHTVDNPEKVLREIVAFANTDGGSLLIGVGDDQKIRGLKTPEEDIIILEEANKKFCKPVVKYQVHKVPVSSKRQVVLIKVPRGNHKPYFIKVPDSNVKVAYVRVNDESIKASREVREILKGSNRNTGVTIRYDEPEQKLMTYLESKDSVTLYQFRKLANITKNVASRILIKLTLAGVLKVNPAPGGDVFEYISQ